jgi:DIRAS family GTP-binding Ras-like protein 2
MRQLAIAQADAIILVYSIDDVTSFDEVTRLREQVIDERRRKTPIPIVVVGNKTDVKSAKRVVVREVAQCTVEIEWGNHFMETSAKENLNITRIFNELLWQE